MPPLPIPTHGRLHTTISLYEAAKPVSDLAVVLHHGICHTRDQFLPLIEQLNARGLHAAMIDQQSENACCRNFIGLSEYRDGMRAAVREIERWCPIGSYALHSMGALIGEEMQQKYPQWRRPTVFLAPIPVAGAWPATWRILKHDPWSWLKAVVTLDVLSLADTPEEVRRIFFDPDTPEEFVHRTTEQLKHAPMWVYIQLTFRWLLRPRIENDGLPKLLLFSDTDYIFRPEEYKRTVVRYRQLEHARLTGGHDFFLQYADVTARHIAEFLGQPVSDSVHIPPPHFPSSRAARRKTLSPRPLGDSTIGN